jgi:uncharacterized membrane protein
MTRTVDSTITAALDGQKASLGRVVRDQKRIVLVAACIVVASFWIGGPTGAWDVAAFFSIGVLIGLVNHIVSEYSLIKTLASGREPSRGEMTRQALVRLLLVGGAAAAVAVVFWTTGIVTLIGLALFRLITLVMTGIPLLKELKRQ